MKKLILLFLVIVSISLFANCDAKADSEIKLIVDNINKNQGVSAVYSLLKKSGKRYQYQIVMNTEDGASIAYLTFDLKDGKVYSSQTPNGDLSEMGEKKEAICVN